jgi:hypothetical protein
MEHLPLSFAIQALRMVSGVVARFWGPAMRVRLVPMGEIPNPDALWVVRPKGIEVQVSAWFVLDSHEKDDLVLYDTEIDTWKPWWRWRKSQHLRLMTRTLVIPGSEPPRLLEVGVTIPKQAYVECGATYSATLPDNKCPTGQYKAHVIFRFKRFFRVHYPLKNLTFRCSRAE